jgi:preprotein translocase subunit SecE
MSIKKSIRTGKTGMDTKKESVDMEVKSYLSLSGMREFMLEVQSEFRKIVWPEKKTTMGLTAFVVLLVVVISLYLGSIDLLIGKLVSMVLH